MNERIYISLLPLYIYQKDAVVSNVSLVGGGTYILQTNRLYIIITTTINDSAIIFLLPNQEERQITM